MSALLLPTNELVACAYLIAAVPGFTAAMVGTGLPQKVESWYQTGFVQVSSVVGGTPNPYVPLNNPVVSVKCWGVNLKTSQNITGQTEYSVQEKPPWQITAQLPERIRNALRQQTGAADSVRTVAMAPGGFAHATVHSAYMLTEPKRALGDLGSYACFQFELFLKWTPQAS